MTGGINKALEADPPNPFMESCPLDALRQVARSVAGHIRKPYSAGEIAAIIESGDYSSEMMMQHLLILATNNAPPSPAGEPMTTANPSPDASVNKKGTGGRLSRLARWFFSPRELIRIQKIELRKLHEYNGSLAKENFELWAELARLKSPLAEAREARFAAELAEAMQEDRYTSLS
jgi:hypothetical protein